MGVKFISGLTVNGLEWERRRRLRMQKLRVVPGGRSWTNMWPEPQKKNPAFSFDSFYKRDKFQWMNLPTQQMFLRNWTEQQETERD